VTTPPHLPPTGLPVEEAVDAVREALASAGAAVLVAPPGAGKTTVVPLRLLGERWLGDQRIIVLEPRRLAARAAAQRMADLLGESLGTTIGYRTRDERVGGASVRVEVVTEGILVRRLQQDPGLEGVGAVVLDEVHERNLVTDLSLGFLTDVRAGLRPDLRVLAMSATVDAARFAELLGAPAGLATVVRSEGRTHPVQVRHLAPGPRDRLDSIAARGVATALDAAGEGDVLVFLPGAADIRRTAARLRVPGALSDTIDVRPLFGALGREEQDLALAPSPPGRRRVVLATDIAESSLTVAGVRAVVDAGLVRVPRLDPLTGMTRLQTEPASVASGDQRAGRAGRLGPGTAIRLWDPSDSSRRPSAPVPEISVADLAGFVLEVAVWGAPLDELPLLDAPPPGAVIQARALLWSLGALDDGDRATARGRAMAELPLHPRLAALALTGAAMDLTWTASVVAAVLEEGDVLRGPPSERPVDLVMRAEVVAGGDHPMADRRTVRLVRRRAEHLCRRLGGRVARLDTDRIAALVAVAYPERLAQANGGGGFRLRGGGGGRVPSGDHLATADWLAVAQLAVGPNGPAVALAVEIDRAEIDRLVGDDAIEVVDLRWDEVRNDLRARTERQAGNLVLASSDGVAAPGPATVALLVEEVRATRGSALRWTPAARTLQGRINFLHRHAPDRWPEVDDAALLAGLETWLAPLLGSASGRDDLERVDVRAALHSMLTPGTHHLLDVLAPTSFAAADGRHVAISYDDGTPRAAARAQWLFGLRVHPTVAAGKVPVVVELLSPAGRPIQITADLPGFWGGSWGAVRKDLAGRYPKHRWPLDPASELPPAPRRRTNGRSS